MHHELQRKTSHETYQAGRPALKTAASCKFLTKSYWGRGGDQIPYNPVKHFQKRNALDVVVIKMLELTKSSWGMQKKQKAEDQNKKPDAGGGRSTENLPTQDPARKQAPKGSSPPTPAKGIAPPHPP